MEECLVPAACQMAVDILKRDKFHTSPLKDADMCQHNMHRWGGGGEGGREGNEKIRFTS